jgi:hypothetical protein
VLSVLQSPTVFAAFWQLAKSSNVELPVSQHPLHASRAQLIVAPNA